MGACYGGGVDRGENDMTKPFEKVAIGETFSCNGNNWTKRSKTTAVGIWPACLPEWAYFRRNEITAPPIELRRA